MCRQHQLAAYEAASAVEHGNQTIGIFVPKCKPDGQYDDMQCMEALGLCWCVDTYGNEIPGTRIRGEPKCHNLKS